MCKDENKLLSDASEKVVTDEDIINAIECCNLGFGSEACYKCAFGDYEEEEHSCSEELCKRELELVRRLKSEKSDLASRIESLTKFASGDATKVVAVPCTVGDTLYEATGFGIREWVVISFEVRSNKFVAYCEGKADSKLHWHFVKTDCCNDFEGKGRIRVTREAAEQRLAELGGQVAGAKCDKHGGSERITQGIYAAGYRKQSDTVREVLTRISKSIACQVGKFGISDLKYIAAEFGVEVEL